MGLTLLDLQVREERRCRCGFSSFLDLHDPMLGLPATAKRSNLQDGISKYFKKNTPDSESKCSGCGSTSHRVLSRCLTEIPDAFYIQINRSNFDPLKAAVADYVGQLNSDYLTLTPTVALPFVNSHVPFTLVAVALFDGSSLEHGHWAADTLNHQWTHYSDLHVSPTTFPQQSPEWIPCQCFFVRSSLLR